MTARKEAVSAARKVALTQCHLKEAVLAAKKAGLTEDQFWSMWSAEGVIALARAAVSDAWHTVDSEDEKT